MLGDVHEGLDFPSEVVDSATVRGNYEFYHYNVDGIDDRGWGCGYRTLQTICSWVCHVLKSKQEVPPVPSLREIQQILVDIGDKPNSFTGSREWIGSVEACLYMDQTFGVCSKIVHVLRGDCAEQEVALVLLEHFKHFGSPVMIGGDIDASSKTLVGVCKTNRGFHFLIADPHFYGKADKTLLQNDGWVQWKHLDEVFKSDSFYNFCLPQLRLEISIRWSVNCPGPPVNIVSKGALSDPVYFDHDVSKVLKFMQALFQYATDIFPCAKLIIKSDQCLMSRKWSEAYMQI